MSELGDVYVSDPYEKGENPVYHFLYNTRKWDEEIERLRLKEKKAMELVNLRPGDDIQTGGVKDDNGKLPWSLYPWDAAIAVLRIISFGAIKYAPRNWEKGLDYSRVYDACLRHLTQWWGGEDKDPDSGMSHLWHAGCNIMFLIAYDLRKVGKDDRP